ncbi:hypothetical protein NDU88_002747 [Pleurodeles waltl]|uniref:Uncharacterized protein n=1 Tax=Pleurodeles waltl TaxID=8319 RepID=A0AAV7P9Z6_PLEWA|nr:hypothetical protein NDU88_002747 [Pleurodeles waltl]
MGGHSPLEQEDGGGPAGDGLPTWEVCPLLHDPPDVPDPGSGLSGVGWAFEGITAATRGFQSSTSATTSPGTVVPAVTGSWSAPSSRAASVPSSQTTDSPPPQKYKKLATAGWEKGNTSGTKGSPRSAVGSGKTAAPPSKVGKGHRKKGKSPQTCTADKTANSTAAKDTAAASTLQRTLPPPAPLHRTTPPPAPLPRTPPPLAPLSRTPPPPPPAPLPRTPPPPAPLHRTPPPPAPLHRTPPPPAPLHRTPPPPAPQANECRKL